MPRLTFLPDHRVVEVPSGSLLTDAVRRAGLPIASACGDTLLCGRCAVRILEGDVAPASEIEVEVKRRNRIAPEERLACALRVRGDLVVHAAYWGDLQ